MTYNTPIASAPWFIYGPYQTPNGNWYCGYVKQSGRLAMSADTHEAFANEAQARHWFDEVDWGLEHHQKMGPY